MSDPNPGLPVKSGAVDTHCHLFLAEAEPPATVEAARAAGVERLICCGIDPETSARSLELADALQGVFATAGMHPHTASEFDAGGQARIEELLHDPRVIAVGECGLDFFRMLSPQADQERALRVHAALSRESGKPMVVHVRDAWDAILRVLDEERADRVVIHCFSGDAAIARECATRGWFMSFAANVTYPKNQHLRDAAAVVPSELLLTETDAPYLAPQRIRGLDNEPANVIDVVEELARVREVDAESVRALTWSNAFRAFASLR